jgi:hypothetical protein
MMPLHLKICLDSPLTTLSLLLLLPPTTPNTTATSPPHPPPQPTRTVPSTVSTHPHPSFINFYYIHLLLSHTCYCKRTSSASKTRSSGLCFGMFTSGLCLGKVLLTIDNFRICYRASPAAVCKTRSSELCSEPSTKAFRHVQISSNQCLAAGSLLTVDSFRICNRGRPAVVSKARSRGLYSKASAKSFKYVHISSYQCFAAGQCF